ncbi:unnamed protein product [Rotaria socialis]|uniref:EF-hand domain-containing protein n=1 Tax=Rotaria socialis TaxID=392032 RepID=A0A817UY63_9BILA|nr:unnamed protein product [Rotaria socialis]CAF3336000.1 unnamed protein product [Rotaria socialis]CAF3346581.1 unnamed protein product [Rotaria socialis]CAF3388906.1 unnamed protein product [Rotaria socialis]
MDLSGFGREDLEQGKLNDMLHKAQQPGGDDEEEDEDTSCRTASDQQANLFSMGSSLLNQFSRGGGGGGGGGGNNSADMIQGAMNAYNMFSGGKNQSSGGGGFLDNISSSYQNAQKMYALYQQFDKNGDGKITVEDIQIYLQEMGLGFVSPYLAQALFQAVDQNHNGSLDFTDLMALTTLLNKMSGQFGGIQK